MVENHSTLVRINDTVGDKGQRYVVLNIWSLISPSPDSVVAMYPDTFIRESLERKGDICPEPGEDLYDPDNPGPFKPVTVLPDDQNPATAVLFWGTGMPH